MILLVIAAGWKTEQSGKELALVQRAERRLRSLTPLWPGSLGRLGAADLFGIDDEQTVKALWREAAVCGFRLMRLPYWIVALGVAFGTASFVIDYLGYGRLGKWVIFGVTSTAFGAAFGRTSAHARKKALSLVLRRHSRCERCGYDLQGCSQGNCPECGTTLPQKLIG